jgi:hypothetical protein
MFQNNTGEIKKGKIKRTNNQVKKHVEQMIPKEINYLSKKLKKLKGKELIFSGHLKKKNISFDKKYIEEIINSEKIEEMIIEYNVTYRNGMSDHRVVLRDKRKKKVKINNKELCFANLCIVLSLDRNNIITAYWNKADDNHSSINWNRYNPYLAVC